MTTVNSRIGSPCACLNRRRTNCRWRLNYRFDACLAFALIREEQIVANSYSSINVGASVRRASQRYNRGGRPAVIGGRMLLSIESLLSSGTAIIIQHSLCIDCRADGQADVSNAV